MKLREYDLLTRMMRTRSLTVASVFYAVGCIFAHILHLSAASALITFAVFLIAALPKHRFRSVFIFLCIAAVGAANFSYQWNASPVVSSETDIELSGRLCGAPTVNSAGDRLILELNQITLNGESMTGKLRLYLRNDDDPDALFENIPAIGQRILCTESHIWQASGATNPGQFDYANYLRLNGIAGYATGKLENAQYADIVTGIHDLTARLRQSIANRIDQLFPLRSDIAKAFLIGDRTQISEEDKTAFSIAGVAHLLAISGMHISLLSYAFMYLLNLRCSRRISFGITLTLLFLYGLLLGFPASLFRAFSMFAISGFAWVLGQRSDSLTSLSCSMLLYLLWKPIQVLSSGFAMSYGATAGIILLVQPITALLHADRLPSIPANASRRRSVVYQIARRALQLLIITLAAQIAILPIVVYCYGAQSILSFVTGLVAIPVAMLAYMIAIPAVILHFPALGILSDALFELLTQIAHVAASIPGASIRIARFPTLLCLACVVIWIIASPLSKIQLKIRKYFPLFIIPAVLIANLCGYIATLGTAVLFTDSGQSDCAIIRSCGNIYLVDTGESGSPAYDYLSMINRDIDGVFITHPHVDHIGGLNKLLTFCTPRKIYITGNWDCYSIEESAREALEACRKAGSEIIIVSAGDKIELSEEASVDVLAPSAGFQPDSANEDSMLLRLTCGESAVLFTGDSAGTDIENIVTDADVLKIPHHGSATSLTETMLEAISPSACVLSVGYNTYGHPTQQALSLIELSGADLYRTDRCGSVDCRLYADGKIHIASYLRQEETYDPS